MQRVRPSAPALVGLSPYDPKYLPARVYLNANESPYGLPASVIQELASSVSQQGFHRYPDPLAKDLRRMIAGLNGVGEGNVLLGNGGDELLLDIMLAWGGRGRKLLTAPPSFSSYELDARLTETSLVEIPRVERRGGGGAHSWLPQSGSGAAGNGSPGESATEGDAAAGDDAVAEKGPAAGELGIDEDAVLRRVARGDIDIVMLASPNNPTGDTLSEDFVLALLDASDAVVLIDQAYVEFADARFDMTRHLERHANLVLLRTFSKAWALAGVRLGYLLASEAVVGELCKVRQPYSVDAFSALAGRAALAASQEVAACVRESVAERGRVAAALAALPGATVFASEANFILFRIEGAHSIWQRLYDEDGILLRDFSAAPRLTDCLRVSIGTPRENDELIAALRRVTGLAGASGEVSEAAGTEAAAKAPLKTGGPS
jgi:histidinol-phosphate aminotransferase